MKKLNVAVLGCTGAVGVEMIKILESRDFPVNELIPLASERSAGKTVLFKREEISVRKTDENSFRNADIVLGALPKERSLFFSEAIKSSGAVYIDNSSAFRLCDDVPLVVPEINPTDIFGHRGIIANPNCCTIITLVAVNAIRMRYGLRSMNVSTYQAVSGAGYGGIAELFENTEQLSQGIKATSKVFPCPIAYNIIPYIGSINENGNTAEEEKLGNEGRKIMHDNTIAIDCTCVRVPVVRSHSMSVYIETEKPFDLEIIKKVLSEAPGCILSEDNPTSNAPMPLFSSDKDKVIIGRVRKSNLSDNGLLLFCSGDQLRKGAALNAVQIAELVSGEKKWSK